MTDAAVSIPDLSPERRALRDTLTGLYSRAFAEESLERELVRARRRRSALTVALLDLDRFHVINDTYGRAAGDDVLRRVAQIILLRIRQEDIAGRYGADEFLLVLPDCPLALGARRLVELRMHVSRARVSLGTLALPPVTASTGVAVFPDHAADAGELVRRAEGALAEAKRGAGNRVVVVNSPLPRPAVERA